jgi:hypothetical protein
LWIVSGQKNRSSEIADEQFYFAKHVRDEFVTKENIHIRALDIIHLDFNEDEPESESCSLSSIFSVSFRPDDSCSTIATELNINY